ncbi:hypothetical protein DXT99_19570 [Pontibacter diazotrophicus]|uniref:Uncharacterized protein n=1 Tax=Pontibacter diazotrophicus TaxID=1400979 RepID=A0A3D8L7P1_9BACT|nr:hypothetical protein [Pontibacter diazotrophicus]RDV13394.1 hypothetical protein DXT99_19570 [Pontibacter diazotrophicus]
MPNQRESNIEDFAFDYIQSYYTTRAGVKTILVDKAERTRQGYVADGFFSYKNSDKRLFIASLSIRNSSKISSLLTGYKKEGLSIRRYIVAALLFAATLYIGLKAAHWAILYVVPILAAFAGFVLSTVLEKKRLKAKVEHLLDDIMHLHADERWLGISISSLVFRNNDIAKHLLSVCQRRGVGVITVGKRAKVVLMQEPQTQTCRRGDFLSHYESEDRIRKALLGDSFLRVA